MLPPTAHATSPNIKNAIDARNIQTPFNDSIAGLNRIFKHSIKKIFLYWVRDRF